MSYNRETRDFVEQHFGGKLPKVAPTNPDGSTLNYYVPTKHGTAQVWVQDQPVPARPNRHACKHRIMVRCPLCGKVVSFGRLHQHYKVHA